MKISKRHYDLVIKQAYDNHPQECGGFLGGKDDKILAVFPIFNQHLYNKTDTFAVSSEDVTRAHAFFQKHGLNYFGVYHTHPNATAEPSAQDLNHIQRYMFIIGMVQFKQPDFAAYSVTGKQYKRLPLEIVDHQNVVDIQSGSSADSKAPPKQVQSSYIEEINTLDSQLNQVLDNDVTDAYHKHQTDDQNKDSDFWTMA